MTALPPADAPVDPGREPGLGDERQTMWRTLAWALIAGAGFALAGRLLAPQQPEELLAGGIIIAACVAGAAAVSVAPQRLPAWFVHVAVAAGTLAITVEVAVNFGSSGDDEVFYLWVTVFAFYFLSRRAALAHMALIAVAYGIAIVLEPASDAQDRLRWLVTIATLTFTGLVIGHLARRRAIALQQLRDAVRSDPLTGLLNRKGFQEAFDAALATARRRSGGLAVIIGDVDRFKLVNDRLGHAAGDGVLRRVASLLESTTRGGDRPARLGGEEFAVLVPDADARQAVAAAERLREAIERALGEGPVPVTISFGVAVLPDHGEDSDALMLAADRALYAAKEAGRNCTRLAGAREVADPRPPA